MGDWATAADSRIDTHVHFWRYDALQYEWCPPKISKTFLPADFARVSSSLSIGGCIAVQARQSIAETDWLLGIADADPRVLGVVGWVPIIDTSERAGRDLARLARHPKLRGVRHVAQDEGDDNYLARPGFIAGARALGPLGLTYDLLIFPRQLPAAITLVRALPDVRFVLDHLAKPGVARGMDMEPWLSHIKELASLPNVVACKVSGIVTEAHHETWTLSDLSPYLDAVVSAFGPQRLMFGSDWPVLELASTYSKWVKTLEQYIACKGWSEEEVAGFWGGVARSAYRV